MQRFSYRYCQHCCSQSKIRCIRIDKWRARTRKSYDRTIQFFCFTRAISKKEGETRGIQFSVALLHTFTAWKKEDANSRTFNRNLLLSPYVGKGCIAGSVRSATGKKWNEISIAIRSSSALFFISKTEIRLYYAFRLDIKFFSSVDRDRCNNIGLVVHLSITYEKTTNIDWFFCPSSDG